MTTHSENMPAETPPSKAAIRRYFALVKEIKADIDIAEQALLRVGRKLTAICEKRLYLCGGYATFADFCQSEFGKTRQHAYRLMNASEVLQNLLSAGIKEPDLPSSERLCREIRTASLNEDEQARVWKTVQAVCRKRGVAPTIVDVKAEADKLLKSDDARIEEQQEELLTKFETINKSLRVGLKFEVLEPRFRRRLVNVLIEMADQIKTLLHAISSPSIDGRTQEKEAS